MSFSCRAAELQMEFYKLRYHQYAEACLHLLSTGQGVVLDRSIFSDHVFAETLRDHGLMSRLEEWRVCCFALLVEYLSIIGLSLIGINEAVNRCFDDVNDGNDS